jgi:hypothetical protein
MNAMNGNKWSLMSMLIIAGLLISVIMGIQGCTNPVNLGNDFLSKPPSAGVTKDSIFSRADRAKKFLWHAYRYLPVRSGIGGRDVTINRDMLASLTDINQSTLSYGGAIPYYYHASYPWPNKGNKWDYNWEWGGIRAAYIFIENVDDVPDMSEATKKRLKAEAQMIIAELYTGYFRNYGGVPWVGHAFNVNEKDLSRPRMTAKATMDSILTLIKKATPNLPFTLQHPETEKGRFTSAGAMGLKCRVLLFAASPLFNSAKPYMEGEAADKKLVWFGGYDANLWSRAADACGDLIKKNQQEGMPYHLVDTGNPQEDFYHGYYDRDSPELLLTNRKQYENTGLWGNNMDGMVWDTGALTDNYIKMFPMANGLPISDPNSGYDPADPYKNRDPRLYQTALVDGMPYQGRKAELWIGGRERKTKTKPAWGYRLYKFVRDLTYGNNLHSPRQWPYLRLPEIYLSYAEALDQEHGGPTAEACKYVNKVRNRVDLGDLPKCKQLSQDEFLHDILRERVLEMGFERTRWFDIVRWKMDDIFTEQLYGMNVCKKGSSPAGACKDQGVGYHESNEYIYSRFTIPARAWKKDWSPKWYLSPFQQKPVQLGLIQNPGWEL